MEFIEREALNGTRHGIPFASRFCKPILLAGGDRWITGEVGISAESVDELDERHRPPPGQRRFEPRWRAVLAPASTWPTGYGLSSCELADLKARVDHKSRQFSIRAR